MIDWSIAPLVTISSSPAAADEPLVTRFQKVNGDEGDMVLFAAEYHRRLIAHYNEYGDDPDGQLLLTASYYSESYDWPFTLGMYRDQETGRDVIEVDWLNSQDEE